jgi:hypothetical protein
MSVEPHDRSCLCPDCEQARQRCTPSWTWRSFRDGLATFLIVGVMVLAGTAVVGLIENADSYGWVSHVAETTITADARLVCRREPGLHLCDRPRRRCFRAR